MNVEYIDHMGDDLSVVNAARVSFAKQHNEFNAEKDTKLINYLAKHKHWTPFAHTALTLRVQAPIPIRTQCFKHKTGLVENEESRRYVSHKPEYYLPLFREQVNNKKQGSGEPLDSVEQIKWRKWFKAKMDQALNDYEFMIQQGIAEEQARFVLPQACEVNWVWTGNLVSFANFVEKRVDPNAQLEIQLLAKKVHKIIKPLFPVAWEALTWHLDI